MSEFTPEWAMAAYNRLQSAQRDISDTERAEALEDSKRQEIRTKMLRRLPRVA